MQLQLPWNASRATPQARTIAIGDERLPVDIHRRKGARRYIVRVTTEGRVRLTVPYGATVAGGLAFAQGHADWVARELAHTRAVNAPWGPGSRVWFRGERLPLRVSAGRVLLGDAFSIPAPAGDDLRPVVVGRLRQLAAGELPERCLELAAMVGRRVRQVSVRNQRARWGACTARGTITLNWRLVQVPIAVRDYVILHELAHLTVPNHSPRFWREVGQLCPAWRDSERWLREHEGQVF